MELFIIQRNEKCREFTIIVLIYTPKDKKIQRKITKGEVPFDVERIE